MVIENKGGFNGWKHDEGQKHFGSLRSCAGCPVANERHYDCPLLNKTIKEEPPINPVLEEMQEAVREGGQ